MVKTITEEEEKIKSSDSEESETALISKMEKFNQEAEEGNASWVDRAIKNYDFYCGKQWNPKTLANLKKEKRPALTINHILPTINLLSGMERENRNDIHVLPRKGGNQVVADVFTGLSKHSMDLSNGEFEQSMQFLDGGIGGKGWIGLDISTDKDIINGDITIDRISSFDIREDPNAKTYDLNKSAKYIIRYYWGDKEQASLLYPKKAEELEGYLEDYSKGAGRDVFEIPVAKQTDTDMLEPSTYRYRIKETWWKSYKLQLYLIDKSNLQFIPVHKSQEAVLEALLTKDRELAEKERRPLHYNTTERVIPVMNVTTTLGDIVLEHIEDPFSGLTLFPYVRFCPYWSDGYIFAVVDNLISPQEEVNKTSSGILHILNRTANTGWLNKKIGGAVKSVLETLGSKAGIVIEYGEVKPEKIEPNQLPAGHFAHKIDSVQNIRDISGLNTASMAAGTKEESGIAMLRRQRQGAVISNVIFDNYKYTQQIFGETLIEFIRHTNVYSPPEIAEICIEEKMKIDPQQLVQAIRSFRIGHYGIKVSSRPSTPTIRLANFEMLARLAEIGMPIPIDILLDSMDIPRKDEMIARVKQQQEQAQQMQMQQGQQGQTQKGRPSPPKRESMVGRAM